MLLAESLRRLVVLERSRGDPEDIGSAVLDLAVDLLAAGEARITVWDLRTRTLAPFLCRGETSPDAEAAYADVVASVFATGRARWEELTSGCHLTAVPIEAPMARLGVLSMQTPTGSTRRAEELMVTDVLSGHLAPALAMDRRDREWRQLTRTMGAVREVADAAGGFFEPLAVSQAVIAQARQLLEADSAGLAWWDGTGLRSYSDHVPSGTAPLWRREKGPFGRTFQRHLEPGKGALGIAYATGRPVVVADYPAWEHALDAAFASVLAVPLLIRGRAIGALIVRYSQRREILPAEVDLLAVLAAQVAPALEAARLNADLAASEVALRQTNLHLAEASRLKSDFLARMSHDLRTPLSAIIGFSDLLLDGADGPLNEDMAEDIGQINRSGKNLLELINDILDLSKIEAGRMEFHLQPVPLLRLVAEVLAVTRPLAAARSLSLDVSVEGDESGLIANCDQMRTRQVLTNLVANSIKFTSSGGVNIVCEAGQTDLQVSVVDTGIGIPPEAQARIFDEFVQADASTASVFGGTGLGLSISKRLIDLQGGSMGVESIPGKGSRFWFRLPRHLVHPASAEAIADLTPDVGWAGQTRDVILVVDDEVNARNLICRRLDEAGFATIQAASGEEAVNVARQERPAAMTLDIRMPGTDGWQVLRTLQSSPVTRDIPVVVVSIVEGRQTAMQLGAAAYLAKPFSQGQLTRAIHHVLPRLRGADVLCVDDEASMRQLLRRSLAAAGVHVRVAASGQQALREMDRKRPDALLVDLVMPGMSGLELIGRLRDKPGFDDTPVIVVSGKTLSNDDRKALEGAIDRFIAKAELREWDLAATVRQAVSSHARSAVLPARANSA